MKTTFGHLWREHGLSMVLLALFAASLAGQIVAGRGALNAERAERGQPPVAWGAYLRHGHFVSATFENWESEFLQMGVYVLLTAFLHQRGSAESRPFEDASGDASAEAETPQRIEPGPTPAPVLRGGIWLRLYENSLTIALLTLFALAFGMHAWGSWSRHVAERIGEGRVPEDFADYLLGAEFWFESFQNWQSEFLAVLTLVLLSIFLRQKDSPQSKPVAAPHRHTGT